MFRNQWTPRVRRPSEKQYSLLASSAPRLLAALFYQKIRRRRYMSLGYVRPGKRKQRSMRQAPG
jgi:hypothetical protein